MGYYINPACAPDKKAQYLVNNHDARKVTQAEAHDAMREGELGVVVVLHNGPFDAAGYVYSMDEFAAFTHPADTRPKTFLIMNKAVAEKLSNYQK